MLHASETSPIAGITSSPYQEFILGKSFLKESNTHPLESRTRCALVDLTNLSRVGFRGEDSAAYLEQFGYQLPEKPNWARQQAEAEWLLRLSKTEYLLLGSVLDIGQHVAQIEQAWHFDDALANYLLPRQDSHAWFQLSGEHIVALMAKVCAVDLCSSAFAVGAVVQSSVARSNAVIVNVSTAYPIFNIFCDRASALYLWQMLLDAMVEFKGQVLGLDAVRT